MLRKFTLVGLLFAITSMIITSVSAQEGYNPTPFTPEDNACYEDGSMWRENPEDGCISDWHWECGWYLARLENKVFTEDDMPSWCEILFTEGEFTPSNLQNNASCGYSVSGSPSVERAMVNIVPTSYVNVSFDWIVPISGQVAVGYTIENGSTYFYSISSTTTSHNTTINNGANIVISVTAHVLGNNENILFSIPCTGLG